MNPYNTSGYAFIVLMILSTAMSVYRTVKLLEDDHRRKYHFWHLIGLQFATLIFSLIVLRHVMELIGVKD